MDGRAVFYVYESDGGPPIGMSLLRGSKLTVEAIPSGEVTIVERPQGLIPEI